MPVASKTKLGLAGCAPDAALTVESWPIDKPVPYIGNARKLTDRAVSVVASSLQEYGWRQPIVVDKKGVVIAGHTRLLAAQSLGLENVPVHVAKSLSPAQADAYRLMDNRSGDESDWNAELLGPQLAKLEKAGFDLALTGFTSSEINAFLKQAELAARQNANEDETPEVPAAPVSRLGDVWVCGGHRVMCGNSTSAEDTRKLFAGKAPDIVFADPPYGVNAVDTKKANTLGYGKIGGGGKTYPVIEGDQSTDAARRFYECAKAAGVGAFILWGGNYFTSFLTASPCWIVWDKQNGSSNFADVEMAVAIIEEGKARGAELAWTSYAKGARLYSFLWNGLCREGDRKSELVSRVHPTQKPVGLFERIFEDFPFASCYDGFLGSGSTLIACEKTGRACYGMEIAPAYVDVSVGRWQNFTGRSATLGAGGAPFCEVKAERVKAA